MTTGLQVRDAVATRVVHLELGAQRYAIQIGQGLLQSANSFSSLDGAGSIAIVTSETVAPLYLDRLRAALPSRNGSPSVVVLADGEERKTWSSLEAIFAGLLEAGADRATTVVALGGGVVGDVAGFAAACYMRGIAYVQVPTTLLAQVDSSVGGKTAINLPEGKNLIGAFHQPALVIADIDVLTTLPQRELVAGLAEIIKYGAIADAEFLGWIEEHLDGLLARDPHDLVHAITRSCEIKASIVAGDERESGLRAVLNFGHTFAHAIEAGAGYGRWLHGEAVGCGMILAADLSSRLGLATAAESMRLKALITRAGLPERAPDLGMDRYERLMSADKKAVRGQAKFVLLQGLGRAIVREVPELQVRQTIAANL